MSAPPSPSPEHVVAELRRRAAALGFDACGIASAGGSRAAALTEFLAEGRHASMGWMAERAAQRASPTALWPAARSVVCLATSYAPAENPLATLARPGCGNISVYARNRDYHDIVKGRLKHLAQYLARFGAVKVFVDTAPVMEKPLAQSAGLGWQGKHTNLVSRRFGSWLLLGEIYTELALPADAPHPDRCGRCTRCQDACPTQAFPAPYRLDARRCLSYLTIEHAGPIPEEFRAALGNRIYGCDDCLAACPWNRFAAATREAKLAARSELVAPDLAGLAALGEAGFRALFAGSPVKRIGWRRFLRNVLIALGNARDIRLRAVAAAHLGDADAVVAEAAAWAVARLEKNP